MSYKTDRVINIGIWFIGLAAWILMVAGCVDQQHVKTDQQLKETVSSPNMITTVQAVQDTDSIDILIHGDRLLTYTSVKQPFPKAVVMYFPETMLADNINIPAPPENDVIAGINAKQLENSGKTARIEILMKPDAGCEVSREGDALKVSFTKAQAAASASGAVETQEKPAGQTEGVTISKPDAVESADNQLRNITVDPMGNGIKVSLNARKPISNYKSFTIESTEGKPARIVFDIYRLSSPFAGEQKIAVDSRWIKQIRHYGDSGKFRLVLDTSDQYLSGFVAHPSDTGLEIVVKTAATSSDKAGSKPAPEPLIDLIAPVGAADADENSPDKASWINRIDFYCEDEGRSTIVVGATRKVKYEIVKVSDKLLQLKLYNSSLADYRQRALITTRFESAVDRILPVQTPGMKNTSVISIEMREAVPYHVEQTDNLIKVHFEASSIAPKPFEQANLPFWKEVADLAAGEKQIQPETGTGAEPAVNSAGTGRKYTGEKIALDFYDTDIKNVFRILMEVSGKNFAIDKEVTGKVTLSLDRPVPWDQVLDLILKMNQLDMVMEGDILRIATIATLKKEEDARRAKIASEQKTKEQEKAVEPLVTEYIPINYSTATDLLSHLQNIVSKDRGSISVDERTNQIILTDVEENIRKAKEIVNHLDKVTPQVLIEARIVEANSTFTKEIGTQWSADGGISNTADNAGIGPQRGYDALGGTYGWNLAMNLPVTEAGSIGFNFSRIFGSPLTIDAKLMAMESKQDGKIISSPRIVTLDNKKATIKQGLEYPYQEKDEDGDISVEFKDIDLILEVTPHITPDNRINMLLKIIKNDVAGVVSTGEPYLTTKEAETELLVEDGDTLVIGGIIKTNTIDTQDGVPGLSKVPVLGWLFKSTQAEKTKEELLIFITPRIVKLEQRAL